MIAALGPEPLGNAFDGAMLAAACAGKKTSLKAALSDQKVVAGLGNIYVCEALHRAHLSPKRQASTLATRGGAPTSAPARSPMPSRPCSTTRSGRRLVAARSPPDRRRPRHFQHSFRVYDRDGANARRRNAKARSGASCRAGARRFFVRCARNSPPAEPACSLRVATRGSAWTWVAVCTGAFT